MDSHFVHADDGVALHVAACGAGPDVVVLSGGPGCVHYLAAEHLAPVGFRSWFPDPRGVGRSGGGPHNIARAVADLEAIRTAVGADRWIVVGHSWGSDLALRYALDHPDRVRGVVGICGRGYQRDRHWSAAYEAGQATETPVPIDYVPEVHASLGEDFTTWIHEPTLWRRLADCPTPVSIVAASKDIRPDWPLRQLAALIPRAGFRCIDGAVHDFWSTEPARWQDVVTAECRVIDEAARYAATRSTNSTIASSICCRPGSSSG